MLEKKWSRIRRKAGSVHFVKIHCAICILLISVLFCMYFNKTKVPLKKKKERKECHEKSCQIP